MKSYLKTFDFKTHAVRVVDRQGAPWFIAADVCRVLDIANPTDALLSLDADEKDKVDRLTLDNPEGQKGGAQTLNIISESGLYSLILRSRKPQARAFRRWVTGEVLPAIRHTGAYALQVAPESDPDRASVLEFLAGKGDTRGWGLDGLIEFGRKVRLLRLNLGAEHQSKTDSNFGRVEVYPRMILETVFTALRPPVIGQEMQLWLYPQEKPLAAA